MYNEHVQFEFDPAKDTKLMQERGISFEDAKRAIQRGEIIVMDGRRPEQKKVAFLHEKKGKMYTFICITEDRGEKIRMITIYPSRKYHKILKGLLL